MKDVLFFGRKTENNDGTFNQFWSGSGIEFNTYSSSLFAYIEACYSANDIWIAAELNGAVLTRVLLTPGINRIGVYAGIPEDTLKCVKIYMDSQADLGNGDHYISIKKLTDKNDNEIEIVKPQEKKLSIEFIGDSITSGEGLAGSQTDYDFSFSYISFKDTYAKITADYYDADFDVISQCGYGIKCGWNNDLSTTLPRIYNFTDGQNTEYDFKSKKHDIIVINLGTNDSGAIDQPPFEKDGNEYKISEEDFYEAGLHFLNYCLSQNPTSKIIWMIGMCECYLEREIKRIVKDAAEPERVHFLKVNPASEIDYGSRQHPGPKTHKAAARYLINKINEILQGTEKRL